MGTVMTCSICRGANHNKRNCPKILNLSLHQHPLKSPPLRKIRVEVNMKEQASATLVQEEVQEVITRRDQELWDKVYLLLIVDIHQGLASIRRVNIGVQSFAHVTGDIGFKPTKRLKWKGEQVMIQRDLQVQSVMRRIQTRSKVVGIQTRAQAKGKSPSKKTS
ncbi:hypothetical protein H5410_041802 [Solanum commersonii]|uniref:Uncharacterized protein n=1 Tax=Solanum commersonii TaxID=4109 RepID=A0A9J5XVS6_SOLCO|nr:hypothetical protein H5410_041802 [Solanum commersonii]